MTSTTPKAVFAIHRGWLAGGLAVIGLASLTVALTFHGWWRLGREVSMSPLEIARAFNAPLLQQAEPNATGDDLKKDFGKEKVRFAVREDGGATNVHQ